MKHTTKAHCIIPRVSNKGNYDFKYIIESTKDELPLKKDLHIKVGGSVNGEYSICIGLSSQRIVLCCHVNEVLNKIRDFVCAKCTYLSSNLFAHLRKKHKHM